MGFTGAMAGLAGCYNVIGSNDEGSNIDTAGFNFSYDEVAKQVEIESSVAQQLTQGTYRFNTAVVMRYSGPN